MNKNFLIIGGGVAGKLLLESIVEEEVECNVMGVLDDNEEIGSEVAEGSVVLGKISDLPQVLNTYIIDRIIIAIPSEKGGLVRRILLLLGDRVDIEIFLLPRVSEIVFTGKVKYEDVRPLELVDLVGEMIVKKDQEKLKKQFQDKVVLVTGGGGSIGSELSKQIYLLKPKKLIILEFSEKNVFYTTLHLNKLKELSPKTELEIILGNVNNLPLLNRIFKENKINYVFHAAAYKHVPILENQTYEAIYNNDFSTFNLAKLSGENKVEKFILISTDKAVQPVNVMGMSKKLAEKIVSYFDDKHVSTTYSAVRFGNVFNSSGSAIELFLDQIEKDNKITITDPDMTRYFMTIPEAVHLVLQAEYFAEKKKFYMLEMGDAINILDLAKCLVAFKKIPISTFDFEIVGTRPGEKKHEILLDEVNEKKVLTKHKRIYSVLPQSSKDNEKFYSELMETFELLNKDEVKDHSIKGNELVYKKLKKLTT